MKAETLFSAPFEFHWSFVRSGYAVLPQGRTVIPIFVYDEGNTIGTKPYAEAPDATNRRWIIGKSDAFRPHTDITFDTSDLHFNGQPISFIMKRDEGMLVKLREPWKNGFQGRLYLGFLLFVTELTAYV